MRYLWVVECFEDGLWQPIEVHAFVTRDAARRQANRIRRLEWPKVRVRRYIGEDR